MYNEHELLVLGAKVAAGFHLIGILSAVQAVMKARTSQGAIAWAISLISFPYVSLPLYWIFGSDRFWGYTIARQNNDFQVRDLRSKNAQPQIDPISAPGLENGRREVLEGLARMSFTPANSAKLCINGQSTFDEIFKAIEGAKEYLLIQFFIVRDDVLGRQFQQKLISAAQRGIRIYFLFDSIGCHALSKKYWRKLANAGIEVRPFLSTKGLKNRFQLNFRNHRKIVVADGTIALVGGHNVGDEYLGKVAKFGLWRDTHVRVEGPAALQVQTSFCEDWHWSSGSLPQVKWEAVAAANPGKSILVMPSGPADGTDTCCLFFLQAINSAKSRIWITSPYFVPDPQILSALHLASLRGVDVRIILPSMADHILVYLASFSFLRDTLPFGVKLFRYQHGFIHEKVLLIDNSVSAVGTANFDNRSFRLNFELTLIFADVDFASQVEAMLLEDFKQCQPVSLSEITERSTAFKFAVQVARLMGPIL